MMNQAIIDDFNAEMDEAESIAWASMTIEALRTLLFSLPRILLATTTEHRTGAQRGFNQTRNTSNNSDGDADADSGLIERNQGEHAPKTSWKEILELLNAFEAKLIKMEGS